MSKAENDVRIKKLVFAGIFAALTYIVFAYLGFKIPTPGGGQVSIHLGNAFVVLGALLLGTWYGAIGGAIGLTIADLIDPVYIVEAPITFVIKLLVGIVVGIIAHKFFNLSSETDQKKILSITVLASAAGLLFNTFADPALRYAYKIVILGKPAADVSFAINFVVTLVNSVISLILVVILYSALRVPLRKAGLLT